MACEHPTIPAGVIRHGNKGALAHYCPDCNTYTYEAVGKKPLRVSCLQPSEDKEKAVMRWLGGK